MFAPISREGALVLNNLFLTTAAATVLVGTLYPLVLEAMTGDKISVGAPFFNLTFGPLMVPLLVIVPFGPHAGLEARRSPGRGAAPVRSRRWPRSCWRPSRSIRRQGGPLLAAVGVRLAIFAIAGALTELSDRIALLSRAAHGVVSPRRRSAALGFRHRARAHAASASRCSASCPRPAASEESIVAHEAAATASPSPAIELRFQGHREARTDRTTRDDVGRFEVRRGGVVIAAVEPAKRIYPARQTGRRRRPASRPSASASSMSRSAIRTDGGAVSARIYWKPLVTLIWLGARGDGARRRAVALRPPAAHRRAARRARRAAVASAE